MNPLFGTPYYMTPYTPSPEEKKPVSRDDVKAFQLQQRLQAVQDTFTFQGGQAHAV